MKRSPVGDGLLAVPGRRDRAEIRFRDLDEVAEDRGVADLERLDAGLFDRALLELRDPVLAFARRRARSSSSGGEVAVAEHAAIPASARAAHRRSPARAAPRRVAAAMQIAERCPCEQRRLLGFDAGESARRRTSAASAALRGRRGDCGICSSAGAQHQQVARIAAGLREPADRALEVADRLQRLAQLAEQKRLARAARRSSPAARAAREIAERMQNPVAQLARAHRRDRAIERAEQRRVASRRRARAPVRDSPASPRPATMNCELR